MKAGLLTVYFDKLLSNYTGDFLVLYLKILILTLLDGELLEGNVDL